jgi:hypothetical protein
MNDGLTRGGGKTFKTTNSNNDNTHKGTLDRPTLDNLVPSSIPNGAKFAYNGTNQPKITSLPDL